MRPEQEHLAQNCVIAIGLFHHLGDIHSINSFALGENDVNFSPEKQSVERRDKFVMLSGIS